MDPARVRSYLQTTCSALGFEIGEVWWCRKNGGKGFLARPIICRPQLTPSPTPKTPDEGPNSSSKSTSKPQQDKRFVQLYTSKSYDAHRSNLIDASEEEDVANVSKHVLSPQVRARSGGRGAGGRAPSQHNTFQRKPHPSFATRFARLSLSSSTPSASPPRWCGRRARPRTASSAGRT